MNFTIGQIFTITYPPEASVWCNQNSAYIEALDDGAYQIKAVPARSFADVKQDKLAEIATAYDSVLAYIISPESYGEIAAALAVADFAADDPEGLAFIRAQLKTRRAELEAAVAAAPDAAAVEAVSVGFAV
jgi:hypothetical protein